MGYGGSRADAAQAIGKSGDNLARNLFDRRYSNFETLPHEDQNHHEHIRALSAPT